MIYTVGNPEVYEPYIKEDENAAKGIGGSVWKSKKEADECGSGLAYCTYGVLADWETDTKPAEEGLTWRSLIRPAKLVKL